MAVARISGGGWRAAFILSIVADAPTAGSPPAISAFSPGGLSASFLLQRLQNMKPEGRGKIGAARAGGVDLGDQGCRRHPARCGQALHLGMESILQREAGAVAVDADGALFRAAHLSLS